MWDIYHGPNHGALNYFGAPAQSWSAGANDLNQWYQYSFGRSVTVVEIQTQGRGDYDQWVTQYRLQYTTDGRVW